VTAAEIPIAALPSEFACAVPSAVAADFNVWVDETRTPLCVTMPLADCSIMARAVLRAAVTAASGAIEMEPAPAPLASDSVAEL